MLAHPDAAGPARLLNLAGCVQGSWQVEASTRHPCRCSECEGGVGHDVSSGTHRSIAVGFIALLTGGVWIGQGLNLIHGGVMTGDRT